MSDDKYALIDAIAANAQAVFRLRKPGALTVILGVEPEDYDADDGDL